MRATRSVGHLQDFGAFAAARAIAAMLAVVGVAVCVAPVVALTTPAMAQNEPAKRRPSRGAPPPTPATPAPAAPAPAPGTPAAPAAPTGPGAPATATDPAMPDVPKAPEPKLGTFVQRGQQKDWVITSRVTVFSDNARQKVPVRDPRTGKTANGPNIAPFEFQTLSVVYPIVNLTAGSDLLPDEYKGVLKLDDKVADNTVTVLKGYPSGLELGRWDAAEQPRAGSAREVMLEVEQAVRCYRLQYDERSARLVPWPTGAWPEAAQSTFRPQLWIDTGLDQSGKVTTYDTATLDKAIQAYLAEEGLKTPKDTPPANLAKILTAKVWRDIQPNGQGLAFRSGTGQLSGFTVQAPGITLSSKRGSAHDIPALLCAMFRRVGLPARVVVGMDVSDGEAGFLRDGGKGKNVHTWVEFFLYDERANVYNWIPVDVVALRKSSSKPLKIDTAWRFFGAGQYEAMVPLALHFHPPTDVVAYGTAGLWGWFVTPAAPQQAEQVLEYTVRSRAIRGGERNKPQK